MMDKLVGTIGTINILQTSCKDMKSPKERVHCRDLEKLTMVDDSESRFCSDQETILQVLDPIHRSLLLNNSEFENAHNYNNNNTTNQHNQSSTVQTVTTCELLKKQQQQQHNVHQSEKQHRKNSTENKHTSYDESSSIKTDVACVSDSDCLMLFHEEFNVSDELECMPPSYDKNQNPNQMPPRKHKVQIRIVNNKRSTGQGQKSIEMMASSSPECQTDCSDSSTSDYVDIDSEVETSSGASDKNQINSGTSTNTDEFSDCNDFNHFESSSTDETATTASMDSNAPMIKIVQEITEHRTVVSTVHVNKKKIKSFQRTKLDRMTVMSNAGTPKWKNKQKIIDDNVCNEMLDENINWNAAEDTEVQNATESPSAPILIGQLKAKPKRSQRKMGKLMERRLSRILTDSVTQPSSQQYQSDTYISTAPQPIDNRRIPPAKPPRTFSSRTSSSKTSTESIGANTATTLPIEDFHRPSASQLNPQMSPAGGWIFDKTFKSTINPTCPTLDDINDFENSKKIGWKHDEFLHVLNMLNDDHPTASKITSSNLRPEPQFRIPFKEDIDQVDSPPPKPMLRRSKRLLLEEQQNSTPVKRPSSLPLRRVPNTDRDETEICKKCKLQIQPSSARRSFGKGAIKRTKLFFKSRNIWAKPKSHKTSVDENCSESEHFGDLEYSADETPTKSNLNRTAEYNTNNSLGFEKRTEKTLDLTPKHSENVNFEGHRRILDKFLTSVKRTPPKKPIRQSLVNKDVARSPSNNEEVNFDFDRVIDSPRREKSFRLSPRKLFCTDNERQYQLHGNSYRSFEGDQRDDLRDCIVEYLRDMNEKIETEGDTAPRRRPRVRNDSVSSDAIDYVPQRHRIVQIDCHPEPVYSEIVSPAPRPTVSSLNHIIVNDNPRAIYTTVNKTKIPKIVKQSAVDVDEIHSSNDEAIHKSCNSLDKLPINNSFADSVLNLLALMKKQNLDDDLESPPETDDPNDEPRVKNSMVVEPPAVQLTSERGQRSVFNANSNAFDDNTSMETYLTETMCDDIVRGDSVNNNIVSSCDRLENLISAMSLVESETDEGVGEQFDEIDYIDRTTVSLEDSGGYCSIAEEATSKDPIALANATKTNREPQLSSLVPAPSMIEIPDQFMLKLTNQIVAQREIRNQLKHAIQICRTTKEFECSDELIEAERLMLISAKKEMNAKGELTRIDYEENGLTFGPEKCVGCVTIKKIEFDLKEEEMLEQIFQLSYICVCSYRDQVVATQSQERDGSKVMFDDIGLKIGNLNSLFDIKVEIFVLRLPRPPRKYSHESKYHLNKISRKTLLPNPVKLFTNSLSASTSKPTVEMEESRFRLRGVSSLSAMALSTDKFEIIRSNSWPKSHVYISYNSKSLNLKINDQFTTMTGALRTEFIFEVNLRDSGLNGFLNVAEENVPMQKMWCRLNGCSLEFWSNDIDCLNRKASLLQIDLVKCTNEVFELIDDKFAVDIFNDDTSGHTVKHRISRYWISAHNQNDLKAWLTDLNRILKFIKDWNI